ncbi:MAG: type II toxin-antitoxin system RelE/ParE family toxin [Clostridiales bacterium]|jgi:plasmid stabilization system protein ParE|nr:type II toxin-antitoxin system RelE/ParE family toxin [Clostridiales bacterium]
MKKYTIILTPRFKKDIRIIFEYIAADNLIEAIEFRQEVYNKIAKLSDFPMIGANPPNPMLQKKNRKLLIYGNYKIYYDINKKLERVEIKDIIHSAKSPKKHDPI